MTPCPPPRSFPSRTAWPFLLALLAIPGVAAAQPVVGFVESFPGVSTSTWSGGSLFSNPGAGGFLGAGDGYLEVSTPSDANLGTVSFGLEYAGDWAAAGIAVVRCRLQDVAGNGNLEIHLSISDGFDTWQHTAGFVPPSGAWGEYVVQMTAADFTQIRGIPGNFDATLQAVDRLHFRHDVSPYGPTPDPITGTFGLDEITLEGEATSVTPSPFAVRPVLLGPGYPNPARGGASFEIQQPEGGDVTVSVFDASGRRVRSETFALAAGASRNWRWDGTDAAGARLPAGIYRVLARGDNGGMTRTVTLLR